MRKITVRILTGVVICGALLFVAYGPLTPTRASIRQEESSEPHALDSHPGDSRPRVDSVALASPGRIEGKSDSIEVGASTDGVIQKIHVREGQQVSRDQVLAEIDCRDLKSQLPVSRAEAESLRQTRERLLRGSRKEEREGAAQRTAAAKAELAQASSQLERSRKLAEAALISRVALDEARRDADVAEAEYQRAARNEELVNAGPLSEELARADADLTAATERIKLAEEKLGKCVVRAPMDGTVLRVLLREGESFALVSPRPILTMADLSGRRVRAEVDERDVGRVHIGERVLISSEAYSGRRFHGAVSRVASVMGRKSVLTGDPVDKSDRDVLEVTAQLDPDAEALPVGLRVTVEFGR
jgi:HlyD family secretion protein